MEIENKPRKTEYMSKLRTFCFEGKFAVFTAVRPQISVGADMLLEHTGFATAYTTLLTHILPFTTTSNIHVILIRLEATCYQLQLKHYLLVKNNLYFVISLQSTFNSLSFKLNLCNFTL